MPTFRKNKNNNKIIKFNISNNNMELIKKLGKLKSQKTFKFKKLLKSKNLFKIDIKKNPIKDFNF